MLIENVSFWLRLSVLVGTLGALSLACGSDDSNKAPESEQLKAPSSLTAAVLPGPAVHLTWTDVANEHHYSIERKEGSGAFAELDTANFNLTQYHDAEVEAGKTYTYRVAAAQATNEKGPFSAEATATP